MALGNLILDETGTIDGVRELSNDASGIKNEIKLTLKGTIRGVEQTTKWTYTALTRPDGSVHGQGTAVMTTVDGDVLDVIGSGAAKTAGPGESTNFRTMLFVHTAAPRFIDLNYVGLVGEYDVTADGIATNRCWEWK
jgi:hypothetical protein|tara:strand:+ start:96 stop:506 length:411 start_codon:yes stop_codon:yes gene_type:complete